MADSMSKDGVNKRAQRAPDSLSFEAASGSHTACAGEVAAWQWT